MDEEVAVQEANIASPMPEEAQAIEKDRRRQSRKKPKLDVDEGTSFFSDRGRGRGRASARGRRGGLERARVRR